MHSLGQAHRYCQSDSNSWDPTVDVTECSSDQLIELQENAAELKQSLIADEVFNVITYLTEVQNVSEETNSFVFASQEQGPILPNDLNTTNNILDAVIW